MQSDPRHRAQFRQLWIDKVRDALDRTEMVLTFDHIAKVQALSVLTGSTAGRVSALSPEALQVELENHGLAAPLPVCAMRALRARGYPQRELTQSEDWPHCHVHVGAALQWCGGDILYNPETQIMLLDDRTATAVAHSKNEPITAAELQHLPHNPCLIEFYRPIEIAETVKRGVRVRAVGFQALGDAEALAAVACFYLDYWEPAQWGIPRRPATIALWYGGFEIGFFDEAANTQIGIPFGTAVPANIMDICRRVARNLWDFVTSRSIRYEHVQRKRIRRSGNQDAAKPVAETPAYLDREVTFLFLSRDCNSAEPEDNRSRAIPRPWDHRIEIPGTFHEYVYCAKCGDLHRHDLLGQSCRKCGEIVGPRANLRVEKYWHSPYVKGPEGTPLKDVVRDVHRRKRK